MKDHRKNKFGGKKTGFSTVPWKTLPLIEVVSNRRVLIENHLGVTSYGLNEINIKVHDGIVEILGDKMEIMCMSRDRVVICGVICGVHLRGYDIHEI